MASSRRLTYLALLVLVGMLCLATLSEARHSLRSKLKARQAIRSEQMESEGSNLAAPEKSEYIPEQAIQYVPVTQSVRVHDAQAPSPTPLLFDDNKRSFPVDPMIKAATVKRSDRDFIAPLIKHKDGSISDGNKTVSPPDSVPAATTTAIPNSFLEIERQAVSDTVARAQESIVEHQQKAWEQQAEIKQRLQDAKKDFDQVLYKVDELNEKVLSKYIPKDNNKSELPLLP